MSFSSFLFFSVSAHTHYLHSFPTRRSSDLRPEISRVPANRSPTYGTCSSAAQKDSTYPIQTISYDRGHPKSPWPPRSEEHTSELQSLTNLVCRLLLEKKKKNKYNI